jgi:hypothetical protein
MQSRFSFVLVVLALTAGSAHAQGAPAAADARWAPWIGCWTPPAGANASAQTQVCIVPSPEGGVQLVSFAGERELLREHFTGDGSSVRLAERDCRGERTSQWAAAGPRLFSSSTLSCGSEAPVATSRLFALVAPDQWLDVQVSTSSGREQVRTQRFWRSSAPPPASVADAIAATAASRPAITAVSVDDVIEASRYLPPNGVEAWLAESTTRVGVDRRALLKLSAAQVPPSIIDLMVAIAYPEKFEVRRGSRASGGGGFWNNPYGDGFYPPEWGYLADMFTYGFGFGYPYWFANGYYYYYPGGINVQPGGGGAPPDAEHGQVVNGLGYTRVVPREASRGTTSRGGPSSRSGAGADAGSAGSDSGGGGSSSTGSSGGVTSSGYSGGGGTSTGLTAVPR